LEAARRLAYLRALGLEPLRSRRQVSADGAAEPASPPPAGGAEPGPIGLSPVDSDGDASSRPAAAAPAAVPSRVAELGWPQLRAAVAACRACPLHESRTQTVFGVGDAEASIMVIGEAPGADEDAQGEPFVGRAGQLLNAMLRAMGFAREQVYIANILKCRPPANRNPSPEEALCCRGFLDRQIELVAPKVILSLGAVSAHNLLGSEEPVGRLRGRFHRYGARQIPLLVSYHPAYLLRRPEEKAKAWQDLQMLMRELR